MAVTAAFKIKRSCSSTPPELLLYFDGDDQEAEVPPVSNWEVSTTLVSTNTALRPSTTENLDIPTTPEISLLSHFNHLEPGNDKFESATQHASESIVEQATSIDIPSTPTLSNISHRPPQLNASPSLSSDQWSNSDSSGINPELYSPVTERSRSSSIVSTYLTKATEKTISVQDPCLQCFLAGLSCSLSTEISFKLRQSRVPRSTTRCRRCSRNGECFCIFQVVVEKKYEDLYQQRRIGGFSSVDYTYYAEGVKKETVMRKAEELLEAKKEKTRFALPKEGLWRRKYLNPVWGAWVSDE